MTKRVFPFLFVCCLVSGSAEAGNVRLIKNTPKGCQTAGLVRAYIENDLSIFNPKYVLGAELLAELKAKAAKLGGAMSKCCAIFAASLFCVGLSGCSMASLDQYGSQVKILENPPQNCEEISGIFYGRGPAEQYAMNNLRNIVGEKGGTHVIITGGNRLMQDFLPVGGNSLTIKGLGYKCGAAAGG